MLEHSFSALASFFFLHAQSSCSRNPKLGSRDGLGPTWRRKSTAGARAPPINCIHIHRKTENLICSMPCHAHAIEWGWCAWEHRGPGQFLCRPCLCLRVCDVSTLLHSLFKASRDFPFLRPLAPGPQLRVFLRAHQVNHDKRATPLPPRDECGWHGDMDP
jgi:hypothetical protein